MVRPGVEAALLAAVALGVAQAGWSILAPSNAGASGASASSEEDTANSDAAVVRSPFAPEFAAMNASSHAAAALLSSVQLAGVRMSIDPAQSGAFLVMNDGAQHAFVVGDEIANGVRLAEVGPEYILLAYQGGQRQISMPTREGFSFARALLGQSQAGAPPEIVQASAPAQQAAMPAGAARADDATFASAPPEPPPHVAGAVDPQDASWLMATLARVETNADGARGWRVGGPVPEAAAQAGLRADDLIVAVNGAGPDDPVAVFGAASSEQAHLTVLRGAERLTISITLQART